MACRAGAAVIYSAMTPFKSRPAARAVRLGGLLLNPRIPTCRICSDRDELANRLAGSTISGADGDTLQGTSGVDTFAFAGSFGNETVEGFTVAGSQHDYLQVNRSQFADWAPPAWRDPAVRIGLADHAG